jgi:hypothetical protein
MAFSDMFASQKRSKHWYISMGGFSGFSFGIRQQCSYQLQKIAYTYSLFICRRANIKRYCKIPFSVNQKNGNNRESKPNHPAHKLVSFLLTA